MENKKRWKCWKHAWELGFFRGGKKSEKILKIF